MSHCSRLDQFEIRTLLMCYLYIVKMISEGWWLLLTEGVVLEGSQKDEESITGCFGLQSQFFYLKKEKKKQQKQNVIFFPSFRYTFSLLEQILPPGADQRPCASRVSIVRLQFKHCTFVLAALARKKK